MIRHLGGCCAAGCLVILLSAVTIGAAIAYHVTHLAGH